jgi:hypothetical protein
MRLRLLRVLFTLTAFAVVWLVTSRANASNESTASSKDAASFAAFASFAPRSVAPAPPPVVPMRDRAPLCDPRGAITFAPPPQMQDVEVTLDTGLTVDDCMAAASGESRHASRGRAPAPTGDPSSMTSDVAVNTAVNKLARASRELTPAPAASTSCSRPGFRSTVDRPPRV